MKRKKKHHTKEHEEIGCEFGSDNVFADLGFDNPEEELLKADLISEITSIIKENGLTQAQAAKIMGITLKKRESSLTFGHQKNDPCIKK